MIIPRDKILHFLIGVFVYVHVAGVTTQLWGFVATCVVGVGIECYQIITKTGVGEVKDTLATILGGVEAWVFFKILGVI